MYDAKVIPWNAGVFGKLGVIQNKAGRLGVQEVVGAETTRGDKG